MSERAAALTRNQALVLDALDRADGPMSAYAVLDDLRGDGLRAPAQIYRALDKLLALGLVHRLETLNAYVSCRHGRRHRGTIVFAICDRCGAVAELTNEAIGAQLSGLARDRDFAVDSAMVELRGRCRGCAAAG